MNVLLTNEKSSLDFGAKTTLLSRFIESLKVSFASACFHEILKPFSVKEYVDHQNMIVMVNRGQVKLKDGKGYAPEGSFYFFPAGKPVSLQFGIEPSDEIDKIQFDAEANRPKYYRSLKSSDDFNHIREYVTVVRFDVQLFGIISFFESLSIPVFKMPANEELGFLLRHLVIEQESNKLGHDKITNNYMEELLIYLCRYIESQPTFNVLLNKLDFLADKRLLEIVNFIGKNLDRDLSNKNLAKIAFVSEDYVGQFFKSLTGTNLQDYVEGQRLEKALVLIKTQPDDIHEIAMKVGFKDAAYFSRRFKIKFGANANSLRQNKVQLA